MSKRSVTIAGHRTSLSLEPEFWTLLHEAAEEDGVPLSQLVARIDEERTTNLSSAIRVWLVRRLQARLEALTGSPSPSPAESPPEPSARREA